MNTQDKIKSVLTVIDLFYQKENARRRRKLRSKNKFKKYGIKYLRDEGMTLHGIGRIFNRDHSSIRYHIKGFDELIKFNVSLGNEYARFVKEVENVLEVDKGK
jgi:hypothetical protein